MDFIKKNKSGRLLHPEELSAKDLNRPVIDEIMSHDAAKEFNIKACVEDAIRIGGELAKQLDGLKPMTRALIVKTLWEHSAQVDKKCYRVLKALGI
jgi:hypothetical protein